MFKVEKCFIKTPALFYNTLRMLLQDIRFPLSVVNYNKLKFVLNFNSS